MSISEAEFKALSVDKMWDAFRELKTDKEAFDQLTQKMTVAVEKIDSLQSSIKKFESELGIVKSVNTALAKSVRSLQVKLNQSDQYSRRDTVEISGVPKDSIDLENKTIKLFEKIDVTVVPSDIVACHPLKREGTVIVKFVNPKNAESVIKNRKKLRKSDTTSVWGTNCVNFINPSLSQENMKIRW